MPKKTTVVYHSADYDGLFCREIARKFLPEAELIGWNFGDPPLDPGLYTLSADSRVYVLDLPCDEPFGLKFPPGKGPESARGFEKYIWIDHHASSIASHPKNIPGYRIDGVAACRLAWQWFNHDAAEDEAMAAAVNLLVKEDYVGRKVSEPLAVRLAGEYDIWDHRGDGDLEFQFGLDCLPESYLQTMLGSDVTADNTTAHAVALGKGAMACYAKRDGDVMRTRSFTVEWEGLRFLALNTPRCNSNTFNAKDVPETGHDALMAFYWNGRVWATSLYHAAHRKDLDLSLIAVKHGGGGHKGACGFTTEKLPFL